MWNEQDARQKLQTLIADYDKLMHNKGLDALTERDVIQQFITPLFRDVLGWPMEDPARLKYEYHTEIGRPDLILLPERGGTVYIEAKKFGIIRPLPREAKKATSPSLGPTQLTLPGMSPDRTKEEQQAINYAFGNNGTWAILTNFEHFRLYNARRDWLVLAFEDPSAYVRDFDLLRQLGYDAILNGSLDALSEQRLRADIDTEYLSFINEAREDLARDLIANPKQNSWGFLPDGTPHVPLLREVVQRYLDRLVLVRFAEDHYVIPPDTLARMLELVQVNIYAPTLDSMIDTLFRNFDARHNSALFAYHTTDEATFTQPTLIKLVNRLYGARYRAFAADILGNTYEQYLGKRLALDAKGDIKTADNLETRKKQGSYYTPQVLVRYLVRRTLGRALYGTHDGTPDGVLAEGETRKTAADIKDLRVLDPACGSGSFLIAAYAVFKEFYEGEITRLQHEKLSEMKRLLREGLTDYEARSATVALDVELERLSDYPKLILENHLYGVDLDPQAVELAVVNLMMRAMERRSSRADMPLPLPLILNQNVKLGNSLVGVMPSDERWKPLAPQLGELIRLRRDLLKLKPGDDHTTLENAIAAVESTVSAALAGETAGFSHPERVKPFHWVMAFPEVFVKPDGTPLENAGFAVVIGNPPWEILKPDLREFYAQFDERIESKLKRTQAEARIKELDAEDPSRAALFAAKNADSLETAAYTRASAAYTRQGKGGDPATQKLFTERAWRLLRDGGRTGLVIPSGIYTDLGTKDLREMFLDEGALEYILSFSNERFFFNGVDHRFKFCLIGAHKGGTSDHFMAAFRFNPRVAIAPDEFDSFVSTPSNLVTVTRDAIKRFSPDSLSVMEFQSQKDYAIADKIYGTHPLIGQTVDGAWNLKFTREFDMTNDRDVFNTAGVGLPLYEGKMIHQFTAYHGQPQYWVREDKGRERLGTKFGHWIDGFRLAFRAIASTTNERTLITTILPPMNFSGHSLFAGKADSDAAQLYFTAVFNSFCLDWLARFKGGANVTLFLVHQLPLPRLTAGHPVFDALVRSAAKLTCTTAAYAALWEQVTGAGWTPESGVTDSAARQTLRDDIDARVAHLFGLSWAEFEHILRTFPLVFPDNAAGAARLKALEKAYVTVG